jgi:hypothetical protein
MDAADNTSDEDEYNSLLGTNPALVVDELSAHCGTPKWSQLIEIAEACSETAGLVNADCGLLAYALGEAVCGMQIEAGKVIALALPHGRWIVDHDAKAEFDFVLGTAYGLMSFLSEPPRLFQTQEAERLYGALEDFVCSLVPELTTEELQQYVEALKTQPAPRRKDRRLDDRRVLVLCLALYWKSAVGNDPDPWKDPTNGQGRGKFWAFVTVASDRLGMEPPHINSVLNWLAEALPKQSMQGSH